MKKKLPRSIINRTDFTWRQWAEATVLEPGSDHTACSLIMVTGIVYKNWQGNLCLLSFFSQKKRPDKNFVVISGNMEGVIKEVREQYPYYQYNNGQIIVFQEEGHFLATIKQPLLLVKIEMNNFDTRPEGLLTAGSVSITCNGEIIGGPLQQEKNNKRPAAFCMCNGSRIPEPSSLLNHF
jgi:hypothetical protein